MYSQKRSLANTRLQDRARTRGSSPEGMAGPYLFLRGYLHLLDIWHQVVGNALRVLANCAALVRSDRIEVPEQHNVPRAVGLVYVTQDVLDKKLGASCQS